MIISDQNTRQLGFWESACKFGHDFFSGTSNVTVRANLMGQLDIPRVQTVLKILFLRHPLLRAIIKEKSRDFYFQLSANFADIPLKILYCERETDRHHKHESFYLHHVEEEQSKPFVIDQFLWKVVLIICEQTQHHTLIVTFHHAITDGLSTESFIHEFLMFYNEQMPFEKLPLLPAIETVLVSNNSWETFIENKTKLNDKKAHQFPFQVYAPLTQRKTHNLYKQFDVDETREIKENCRSHGTTMTAFLNAVLMITACQMEDAEMNIGLHTPVNLRNLAIEKIKPYHLGCYISMVKTIHENIHATDDIWILAKAYKKELQSEILKTGFYPKNFSLKNFEINELVDLFDMAGSSKRKYFTIGFGITNIGELNLLKTYGSLDIDDFMFTTNHVMGEYLVFLHVLTLHGKLKICFNYTVPLVSNEWAAKFVKQFENNIRGALND